MKYIAVLVLGLYGLTPCYSQAAELVECIYATKDYEADFEPHADCADVTTRGISIAPEHLARMHFSKGPATVLIGRQHFYVKPEGTLLPVITYDNSADFFAEGLTRSLIGGKVAFYDSDFRQVIPPKYDWAFPFEGGRAIVCIGCKLGEPDLLCCHREVTGGRWGVINRQGLEVLPVVFSKEEVLKKE